MKTQTENIRNHIGQTITITWGTSRGRDSYGYTTCSLRNGTGKRIAACNGGGYDMRGTVIGNWVAYAFSNELRALKPRQMPEDTHWQPERARYCDGDCKVKAEKEFLAKVIAEDSDAKVELARLPEDCFECPTCKGPTRASREGKRVSLGRKFYGLTFHDPNYDPGKAVIGKDCSNRTMTGEKAAGKTVEQAEQDGDSLGLERYQAFYAASSPVPTKRHTIPQIDGACGLSSVLRILNAIGLDLRQIHDSKKTDIYMICEYKRTN